MATDTKQAYLFPRDKKALAAALATVLELGKTSLRGRTLGWLIHYFYLMGIRDFPLINATTGSVRISWVTRDQRLPFKYPGALKQHMTEMGRLLQVDVSPLVEATADGLTVLRDRALAQVSLDALTTESNRDKVKQHITNLLLNFGTAGLSAYVYGSADTGYHAELEAIPPWELTPIPHAPFCLSQLQGLSRDRFIPISDAIARFGKTILSKNFDELECLRLPYGEYQDSALEDTGLAATGLNQPTVAAEPAKQPKGTLRGEIDDDRSMLYMHLHEVWLTGRGDELRRYIVRSGLVILKDEEFPEGAGTAVPIHISRYGDTGSFYGASYADLVVGLNREAEKNIQNLLENARNLDKYGFLVLPSDMGAQMKIHSQDQGNGLRVMFWQPSQFTEKMSRPQIIQPATTSNFPGDVAAFIVGQLNQITKDTSLTLPARTDSANAIGMIDEASRRPITQTLKGLASQFGNVYRYIVMQATEFYAQKTPVFLSEIDDNLAGIILNPASGQVQLELGFQPKTEGLRFTIRSFNPNEKELIKREIYQMVQMGMEDPAAVRFLNLKYKLRMPFAETPEINTYRTTMLNNILLFNDGQTPGQIVASGLVDSPRIAMMGVANFMTRPFFRFASVEVRQAFENLYQGYQMSLTVPRMQPQGQPMPEDIMQRGEDSQQPQPQ